jgi:peptidoglycan/xylan/chitin deacetylase (PgdA/CDA1 family)
VNPLVAAAGAATERLLAARDRVFGARTGLTLVGWHRVDGGRTGLSTTVEEFVTHLDVIERDGWHVHALPDALAKLADGTLPLKSLSLTFDDAYASVAEIAWPLLRARGWPATLYAVSGYLDGASTFGWDKPDDAGARLLSAAALRDVAASGMHIGSHTVTHPWLPHLDPASLAREVSESRATLEDVLGLPVTDFAYPMGGWNAAVRAAVVAAGYSSAVTVDRGRNTARSDCFALRRAFAPRTEIDFARTLDGAYAFLRPLDKWRTRSGPAWQE